MIKMITLKIFCIGNCILMNYIIAETESQDKNRGNDSKEISTLTKFVPDRDTNPFNRTDIQISNLTETEMLLRKLNETAYHLYQLEWKVIIKQRIDNYEIQFDEFELAQITGPRFQLNETLIKKTPVTSDYDKLAERRTQKWLHYLDHPTGWASFENLVKRVNVSKFTAEEFCRGLAMLYKRISWDILVEAMHFENDVERTVTSPRYLDLNFVIAILLDDLDIVQTDPIRNMVNELKIFHPDEIWLENMQTW